MSEALLAGAVIAAAGASRRMGGVDKVFADLAGRPLLAWSVDVFESCPSVHRIVVVLRSEQLAQGKALSEERGWGKVAAFCPGGERRQDSVRAGLRRLEGCEWVVVHDGARPMVTSDIIERGLEAAQKTGAAIAAVPVIDTIKAVEPDGFVSATVPRKGLWAAQTPQVFRYQLLLQAHEAATETATDDAAMVEALGCPVSVYRGSYANIKVTSPEDLPLAEAILRQRRRCANLGLHSAL